MQCVATKIDNPIHRKVMEKCNGQGCTISEYVRNLILRDLNRENSAPIEKVNEDNQVPKVKVTSIDDIPEVNGELQFEGEEIEIED